MYEAKYFNLRLPIHKYGNVISVNLPKKIADDLKLNKDDEIEIVIHTLYKDGKVINICNLKF
jgi:antitoxin component of MazEF toxin-antitoxin module